jgi:predicted PurR-regulated permease PerM
MIQNKIIERYFFFGLLFATLVFTFLLFRPFWAVLVLGMSFSVVVYPIYEWFKMRNFPNAMASLLTVICFTVILCGPILGLGTLIFKQSENVYHSVLDEESAGPFLDKLDNGIDAVLPDGMNLNLRERVNESVSYVSENIANVFKSTVSTLFSFILMLLIMFYFLKDGARWKEALIVLSPLSDKDDEHIIRRLKTGVETVIMGNLLISLIQGALMGLGLWIFGIPNPALWGMVAALSSLLPTIGTALVSVPAIIFLFSTGHTAAAVGLIIWSVLAVGMIDNFLSPVFVGRRMNIPPLLILFAVLGGVSFLGPVGILMGPLTVSLLYTLISIYRNEFKQTPTF